MVASGCDFVVSPAPATSSTSPPLCRTSRRWRCVYSARQEVECARRLHKWHGNPAVVFAGQGGDAQPTVSPKRFPNSKANYGRAFFDSIGQTEKNSVRAYVFRFALELGHYPMTCALRIFADSFSKVFSSHRSQIFLA